MKQEIRLLSNLLTTNMPLLNAAIVPHSPILISEIGKINQQILDKTVKAYQDLADELQGNDIETIIIISPHGQVQPDRFTVNLGPEAAIDLSTFGFLGAKRKFTSDLDFIDHLKNTEGTEIQLISQPNLDYGSSIPLYLLTAKMPDVKIVCLSYASELDLAEHFALGERLNQVIKQSARRIAIIASGDLSPRLKKNSPSGYSPKGAKFDNKIMEFLSNPESVRENILNMDSKLIADASACGLKPITILLGALTERSYQPERLAYQTDLGIGYLTMDFKLD